MILITGLAPGLASSQAVSPLHQNGFGRLHDPVFSVNRAMGNLAAGYRSATAINAGNPASYSGLVLTTFEMGAFLEGQTISQPEQSFQSVGGNVSHLALGVPLKAGKAGLAFGLSPYSTIKYNFANTVDDPLLGGYDAVAEGDGSTYRLFAGTGLRFGDASVGINANFIFGSNDYLNGARFTDSLDLNNVQNHRRLRVRGIQLDLGAQYTIRINDLAAEDENKTPLFLTLGAVVTPGISMRVLVDDYWETTVTNTISGDEFPIDTAAGGVFGDVQRITMPWTVSAGMTIGDKERWMAGVDGRFATWENARFPSLNGPLRNSWTVKLGGQITPVKENGNYFNRMQYRAGFYAGRSEQVAEGEQVSMFGTTFGLSFPTKRSFSRINLMADIGQMAAQETKQTFYDLTLSFTLNSRWFVKPKYD